MTPTITLAIFFSSPDHNKIDEESSTWKLFTLAVWSYPPLPSCHPDTQHQARPHLNIYPNSSRMQIAIGLSNLWCRRVGGGVNDAAGSYSSWVGLSLIRSTKTRGHFISLDSADGKHRGVMHMNNISNQTYFMNYRRNISRLLVKTRTNGWLKFNYSILSKF